MADNIIIVGTITALSGLIGALATQLITGRNTRIGDERKNEFEINKTKLLRKIEVGENFYLLTGDNLQRMKDFVFYLETKGLVKSDFSIDHLHNIFDKIQDNKTLIDSNNSANLVNLYFEVTANFDLVSEADIVGHSIFINLGELNYLIDNTDNAQRKEELAKEVQSLLKQLITHFNGNMERARLDMSIIKTELNKSLRSLKNKI